MSLRRFNNSAPHRRLLQLAVVLTAGLCTLRAQTPAAANEAAAQTRLPHILSDHAVLQRDRPIHIWGWDAPDASVTVEFRHQHATTHANELGTWSVYLNPEPPGGPD